MSNEEAKQDIIKVAWGVNRWTEFGDKITKDGWLDEDWIVNKLIVDLSDCDLENGAFIQLDDLTMYYRPKSLKGIDYNNGWTRIEPDGSNLPRSGNYKFLNANNPRDDGKNQYVYDELRTDQFASWFTHYRAIVEEPKPIY